jgi:hypothetical protein
MNSLMLLVLAKKGSKIGFKLRLRMAFSCLSSPRLNTACADVH